MTPPWAMSREIRIYHTGPSATAGCPSAKNSTTKTRHTQRFDLLTHVGNEGSQFRQVGTFSAPLPGGVTPRF